ncbi:MAG TPA: ammonia channel protein, partial [Syntrophobacteraceae bacterium]|nr:ammonia channel protein [Syntrophobacteraceae bacterium]
AGHVSPMAALLIGLVAGVICFYGVRLKFKGGFDDSLDVVGVHGVGGIWGPLATGLFATVGGQGLLAGNPRQLGIQLLAVVAVGLYCYLVTYGICWAIDKTMGLRVEEDQEMAGLDRELHGEVGYTF